MTDYHDFRDINAEVGFIPSVMAHSGSRWAPWNATWTSRSRSFASALTSRKRTNKLTRGTPGAAWPSVFRVDASVSAEMCDGPLRPSVWATRKTAACLARQERARTWERSNQPVPSTRTSGASKDQERASGSQLAEDRMRLFQSFKCSACCCLLLL